MYTPELGQAVFGNPWGEYEAGEFIEALLLHVLHEIERVYWNREQKEWSWYDDPKIPHITFQPYYWGDDEKEALKPNFTIDGEDVEIRWYKHPHRGLTVNKEHDADWWKDWVEKAIEYIRQYERSIDPIYS